MSVRKGVLAAFVMGSFVVSGCSTTTNSVSSLQVSGPVNHDVEADIEVGEKISGEASYGRILFFPFGGGDTKFAEGVNYGSTPSFTTVGSQQLHRARAAAAYNALEDSDADVLVAPRYYIDTTDLFFFANTSVRVEGYEGTINSIE